jgi:hypothetical protein
MTRPPLLQAPIHLSGAQPSEKVQEVCRKAAPVAGAVGTALLGAAAGYFAPRVFEWIGRKISGDDQADDGETIELDTGP